MSTTDPRPDDLADAFFAVAHALKRTVNVRYHRTGLSMARLKVLFTVTDRGPLRIGELSQLIDVAPRTMTSTVDAMERDGLVRRERDPGDGRATVVHLTEDGHRASEEGRLLQVGAVADIFGALDREERVALASILRHLAAGSGTADAALAKVLALGEPAGYPPASGAPTG